MFEVKVRDGLARVCRLTVDGHRIKTPTIAIVVNPNKMLLSFKELEKLGVELVITNAYILYRSGYRKLFKWKGAVYTDSGTYQMFSRNVKDIDNRTIVEYQVKLKSNFVTPVDVFTTPEDDYATALKKLRSTFERIEEAHRIAGERLVIPIQGGKFLKLRKMACMFANKFESARVFAVGGIVPYMISYRYKELVDILLSCKSVLNTSKPLHAFGCGHPMCFALLALCGVDIFDSAMYALSARENRYLTPYGTIDVRDLEEFPCNCSVCSKYTPQELREMEKEEREKLIAMHNINVTLQEIRAVRTAIREERIWEYAIARCTSHASLKLAIDFVLRKYRKLFKEFCSFPKRAGIQFQGRETLKRPEIEIGKELAKRVKERKKMRIKFLGEVPESLYYSYPFFHFENGEEKREVSVDDRERVADVIKYQFGCEVDKEKLSFTYSRTGKIREIYYDGKKIGFLHPETGLIQLTVEGCRLMKDCVKKVAVLKEAEKHVREGKDLLAKFARSVDKDVRPNEEVAIVNEEGEIVACGRALLSSREIDEFSYGIAVKVRDCVKER